MASRMGPNMGVEVADKLAGVTVAPITSATLSTPKPRGIC